MANANNPPDEFWSWQGPQMATAVSLQQSWLNISTLGGSRFGLPPLRGGNYAVPFAAGQTNRPKYPDSRVVSLVMWAAGIDQSSGNPATDQRLAWNNNWQQLRGMFWQRNALGSTQGTLTRRWFVTQAGVPGIVVATALAEVAGPMEPTMSGRYRSSFSVDLLLADPYFYGPAASRSCPYATPTTLLNTGEGVAGEGTGTMQVVFNGPLTTPTLTNSSLGLTLTLNMSLAPGFSVTVDAIANTALGSDGNRYDSLVSHVGSRMWFALQGNGGNQAGGSNVCNLTSALGTDTGTVAVTWQPPYV